MIPQGWRVTWKARGREPAGSVDIKQRAAARALVRQLRADGFIARMVPIP